MDNESSMVEKESSSEISGEESVEGSISVEIEYNENDQGPNRNLESEFSEKLKSSFQFYNSKLVT